MSRHKPSAPRRIAAAERVIDTTPNERHQTELDIAVGRGMISASRYSGFLWLQKLHANTQRQQVTSALAPMVSRSTTADSIQRPQLGRLQASETLNRMLEKLGPTNEELTRALFSGAGWRSAVEQVVGVTDLKSQGKVLDRCFKDILSVITRAGLTLKREDFIAVKEANQLREDI